MTSPKQIQNMNIIEHGSVSWDLLKNATNNRKTARRIEIIEDIGQIVMEYDDLFDMRLLMLLDEVWKQMCYLKLENKDNARFMAHFEHIETLLETKIE